MLNRESFAGVTFGIWVALLAVWPAQASGAITFDGTESQRGFASYVAFLSRHPAKYARELAAVEQLERSDVEYQVRVGGEFREDVDGELTTDGERIFIRISNGSGRDGKVISFLSRFSERGCFAHELEHARQFDDGEFAFVRDPATGVWHAECPTFDISDEMRAWEAQLQVSSGKDFWRRHEGTELRPSLLASFAQAPTDDERMRVLRKHGYGNLYAVPNCVVAARGPDFRPGQIMRPGTVANLFGRVFQGDRAGRAR